MGRPKGRTHVSHSKEEKLESRQSNIESNWQLNCFFLCLLTIDYVIS